MLGQGKPWVPSNLCLVECLLLLLLLQLFQRTFPSAIFIDMKLAAARLLADQGAAEGGPTMAVNDMGLETVIDVQKYNIAFNKVGGGAGVVGTRVEAAQCRAGE
jgi:hypothetical protein